MKQEVICKVCKTKFMARTADLKRGWAKCCSKSCAATLSNAKTGKYKKHLRAQKIENTFYNSHTMEWDGHKYEI